MAKRYRTFKRVRMTVRSAEAFVAKLVDLTFDAHFQTCCVKCREITKKDTLHCKSCGEDTKKRRKDYQCEQGTCPHVEKRTLDCARLVESGMKISKTKAYIDIPGEDPELLRVFGERVRSFAGKAGKAASAFLRVAETAEQHARRGWLHQLAECGLDVDQEHLGEQ